LNPREHDYHITHFFMKGVADIFISKEKLAVFWFLVAVGCITVTGWYLYGLAITSRGSILYVPTQDAFVHLDRFSQDQQSLEEQLTELVDYHTRLVMDTFLNRGPKGPVNPERLSVLFSESGLAMAMAEIQDRKYDFKNQQIHQMVELGQVSIVHLPDGGAVSVPSGQLVRVSTDPTTKEIVTKGFLLREVKLQWTRNPNLRMSRRFPYLCSAIEYQLEEMSAVAADEEKQ